MSKKTRPHSRIRLSINIGNLDGGELNYVSATGRKWVPEKILKGSLFVKKKTQGARRLFSSKYARRIRKKRHKKYKQTCVYTIMPHETIIIIIKIRLVYKFLHYNYYYIFGVFYVSICTTGSAV